MDQNNISWDGGPFQRFHEAIESIFSTYTPERYRNIPSRIPYPHSLLNPSNRKRQGFHKTRVTKSLTDFYYPFTF